jgi:hypothetical protein
MGAEVGSNEFALEAQLAEKLRISNGTAERAEIDTVLDNFDPIRRYAAGGEVPAESVSHRD